MRRLAPLLLLGAPLVAACGTDAVHDSSLPTVPVAQVAGPSYVEQVQNGRQHTLIHTPTATTRVHGVADAVWRADGLVVVAGSDWARLLDPATGRWLSRSVPVRLDGYGITPEALSALDAGHGLRVRVYGPDLDLLRVVRVPAAKAGTDQLGEDAELSLHGRPLTLDGVTWVQWAVDSEDDTLTDHGVFRIEGARITPVLRNEPVVSLQASTDGGALLAVVQDNGEDEDCGGCTVEQKVVELDPGDGTVAADYGMPPGYDRSWRISALDKMGDTVVVRFELREGESGTLDQTWQYDGTWSRVPSAGRGRTRFQRGGALEWIGDTGEENRPYRLVWRPTAGDDRVLRDRRTPCPTDRTGWTACPSVRIPGSLLPGKGSGPGA